MGPAAAADLIGRAARRVTVRVEVAVRSLRIVDAAFPGAFPRNP
jgi:hypothetical protein